MVWVSAGGGPVIIGGVAGVIVLVGSDVSAATCRSSAVRSARRWSWPFDPAELLAGFHHARRTPTQCHL
jgi:hypothetical protein